MRIVMLVCSILGFALFLPIGFFAAGPINIGAGIFSGVIGALIGLLLTHPFRFVLRKDAKQEIVDKAEPIRLEAPLTVQGLWRFDSHLVFDPQKAVFPQRCIFTNKKVTVLRPFTIGQVTAIPVGPIPLVFKKTQVEYLPISKEWLRNRQRVSRIVQRIAIGVFVFGIIASLAGWYLTGNPGSGFITLLCFIGLLISMALHRMGDFGDRQELYSSYFLEDGRIIILAPHPDFIAGLPELKKGVLHGFMGIEQLEEVAAD
ncbi:MAG: hypothetical protein JNL67_06960 [Planctomycetaceae bacterium]|nr:hypothetical protein [Planctomycetaceae bacterium]